MNRRCGFILYIFSLAGTALCISFFTLHVPPALAQDPHPTPTYDPLAQPDLPPNPTDLEMGRYLFWRHCMPCHGDVGQGLTDEFRVLWEEHANCWERGCHGGRNEDEGFPIPTVIPPIVTDAHLMQFTSEEQLLAYLKATHPPQYPGHLEDEEYHDIVVILFQMNNRPLDETISIPSPTTAAISIPVHTSTPGQLEPVDNAPPTASLLFAGLSLAFLIIVVFWARQKPRGH